MQRIRVPGNGIVSYDKYGSGPPLVLVHGAFSDHHTNWELVKPILRERFTVYALARRGRGATTVTEGHSLEDEVGDLLTVIDLVPEPVFLLGHSYGAHCALAAARLVPGRIRRLVLYEPLWPSRITDRDMAHLERLASAQEWDAVPYTFFRDSLSVPAHELDALRATDSWPAIVADAEASLGDLRALKNYRFDAERFRGLDVPVLLQIGSESPRDLYVTDALAAVLPNVQVQELPGQAHEGMTTAPEMYAEAVADFLLERNAAIVA